MTKQALQEQHRMIIGIDHGSSDDATKLSIEYAISVLEDIRDGDTANQFYFEDAVKTKIKELECLLKSPSKKPF